MKKTIVLLLACLILQAVGAQKQRKKKQPD